MSTPGQQAQPAPTPNQPARAQTQGRAATPTTQQAQQPQPQPAPAKQPSARAVASKATRSSTPWRLRVARGLATAAALLTGVVATGTFDTSGVNATPNVIASEWHAAEAAGTELAGAELEVARGVAEGTVGTGGEADGTAFADHLRVAAEQQSRSGVGTSAGLVDVALSGDRALRAAGGDALAAGTAYQEFSDLNRTALDTNNTTAQARADALMTGSRSVLTSVVGGLSTLLLVGLLVWLALLTRRIINVPLLVATAITAGLTYVSLNPSALPVNFDQQVEQTHAAAQALEDVRLARAAQYAEALGVDTADGAVADAAASVASLNDAAVTPAWAEVAATQTDVTAAGSGAAKLEVLTGSQDAFDAVEQQLADRAGEGTVSDSTGRSATITAGLAFVLGVIAAFLAWTGVTQRLRDYR